MTTGRDEQVGYSLANVGIVTLENANERPLYNSIVIRQNKIVVVDINDTKVKIHRLNDGKLVDMLDSDSRPRDKVKIHRLHDGKFVDMLDSDSRPRDICLKDATTVCVLHLNGLIEMASIKSENVSPVFTRMKSFRLDGVFDDYHSVVRVKDNIVVVGVKQDTTYWCIVSLDDGHVDKIHRICKCSLWSYMTTKDNIIYISCCASDDDNDDTGVYVFDILNPSQCKYKYKHQRLRCPRSIVINEDWNIFVGNGDKFGEFFHDSCIHQLTASCKLVDIFTQGIPRCLRDMFWDNGRLYVTCDWSHDITVFRHVYRESHNESEVLVSYERKLPGIEESAKYVTLGNVDNGQSSVETEMTPSGPSPEYSEDEKQENHTDSEVPIGNEGKELVIEGTPAQVGQEIVDNGQSSVDTESTPSGPGPENSEVDTQGNHTDLEVPISNEGKQPVIQVTSAQIGQEIVHDPSAPRTREHMNHARLCVAIVTICGNAMRTILLANPPAPHTNIFQAILANKTKLISETQKESGKRQKALLNKDQCKIIFPDRTHGAVASIDKFDISSLYTLIRNFSSVKPPSTAWGVAPRDRPRDKSLGANVERIHLYRNEICGHSLDRPISQQKFNNYWKNIDSVLRDIGVIVGKAFSQELETQRIGGLRL